MSVNGGTAYAFHIDGANIAASDVATSEIIRVFFNGAQFDILETFTNKEYYGTVDGGLWS